MKIHPIPLGLTAAIAIGTAGLLHRALQDTPLLIPPARPIAPPTTTTNPIQGALAGLSTKIPELSLLGLHEGAPYGPNTVVAHYTTAGGGLEIIANAYDSATTAAAGQSQDAAGISVGPDRSEIIRGVKVYEYTHYGGLYFQSGRYTFRFQTGRGGNADVQLLLVKAASVLIAELAPAAKSDSDPSP